MNTAPRKGWAFGDKLNTQQANEFYGWVHADTDGNTWAVIDDLIIHLDCVQWDGFDRSVYVVTMYRASECIAHIDEGFDSKTIESTQVFENLHEASEAFFAPQRAKVTRLFNYF